MAWLAGWSYRKSHVIEAAAGAGTNYPKRIVVHYGSGSDSGEDVYLNEKCRTDFGDVRFTDDDGTTELDYWMEKKVDSDYAIFWVEVADDLSSENQTIYVYYGKADATTTSNGANTFIYFEDFESYVEDSDLDGQGIWSKDAAWDAGEYLTADTFDGSKKAHMHTQSTTSSNYFSGDFATQSFPKRVQFIFRTSNITSDSLYPIKLSDGTNIYLHLQIYASKLQYWNGASYADIMDVSADTWYKIRLDIVDNNQIRLFVDDVDKGLVDFNGTGADLDAFNLGAYKNWLGEAYWDDIFIAKYVSPEPAHGDWGEEETAPVSVASGSSIISAVLDALVT